MVGLGPGDEDLVTSGTIAAIAGVARRRSRTDRHPAVGVLGEHESFDARYEAAEVIEEVYTGIVRDLIAEAQTHGEVLYAVPGSPAVAERTVELLRDPLGAAAIAGVEVEVLPALSFLDLAWVRLGIDPVALGVQIVDGHRFVVEAAGATGPLLVAQCDTEQVLSTVKLAFDEWPDTPVTVLARLGLPDEDVRTVRWEDLDRIVEPDHLTSLYLPQLGAPIAAELVAFAELVERLRRDCPWDREQTHQSLTRHLLEESYEVIEAIDELDGDVPASIDHLQEELGDLLFQVVFHATLAVESGWFTLADVARGIHDKLVARHPHVFGDAEAATAAEVLERWERIKRDEKGRTSVVEGVPTNLPAGLLALKLMKKAVAVGVDFADRDEALGKVHEELGELRTELERPPGDSDDEAIADELGDLLFAACGVGWTIGVDPEAALRHAALRFRDRVAALEAHAAADGVDPATADRTVLDALWSRAKLA